MRHFVLFTLTLFFIACNTDTKKAIQHLNKAIQFHNRKDFVNATKEIEDAKKLDSTNLEIKLWDSKIKYKNNLFDESIRLLNNLIKQNYKPDTIYYLIALNYFQIAFNKTFQKPDESRDSKGYRDAINYFDSAILKNNLYFSAYLDKARAYHNINEYNDGIIVLNNALSLFPDSLILAFKRGVEKKYLGDESGALIDLNKVIQSTYDDSLILADAYRYHALIYLERGSTDTAINDFTKSINLDPKNELYYYGRAMCYEKNKMKEKACADLRKAADLGMTSATMEIHDYCEK